MKITLNVKSQKCTLIYLFLNVLPPSFMLVENVQITKANLINLNSSSDRMILTFSIK